MTSIIDARLTKIEERRELMLETFRVFDAKPGAITDQFFNEDVPWLIEQVRTRHLRLVSAEGSR